MVCDITLALVLKKNVNFYLIYIYIFLCKKLEEKRRIKQWSLNFFISLVGTDSEPAALYYTPITVLVIEVDPLNRG
jgi:hypothetical protein